MLEKKSSENSFAQVKSKIKVVFLGQQSTGKTSILLRFIHDRFQQGLGPTIGIDFMAKNLHIGTNILRMQLWDTAGQQRFRSLIPSYLKDALIAFIVFDLTNQKSFENLNEWIDLCHNNKKQKTVLVLLGNKADLKDHRQVREEQIKAKVEETSLPYYEVSAKTGFNIKEVFNFAGQEYFNNHLNSSDLTFSSTGIDKTKSQVIQEEDESNHVAQKRKSATPPMKKKRIENIEAKQEIKLKKQIKKNEPKKKGCC